MDEAITLSDGTKARAYIERMRRKVDALKEPGK